MKLFAGLSRTDYEDVFRAIGALIDERGWSNVSLMEVDEGVVVQVMERPSLRETRPRLETYLLTDTDLERVMRDAALQHYKQPAPPVFVAPPELPPLAPPAPHVLPEPLLPAPSEARTFPTPGRLVEERLVSMATARGPLAMRDASSAAAEGPLPPLPTLDGLPGERPLGAGGASEPPLPLAEAAPVPFTVPDESPFVPAPLRLSAAPAPPTIDAGVARAAVVMAHIVAARLKSGMPMTGDDPDLASLLEQVRALDQTGIGNG